MRLKPIYDRVLVERLPSESETKGGIVIPDVAQQKMLRGVVLDRGPGEIVKGKRMPPPMDEGDQVLFSDRTGTEIDYKGKDCILLKESFT